MKPRINPFVRVSSLLAAAFIALTAFAYGEILSFDGNEVAGVITADTGSSTWNGSNYVFAASNANSSPILNTLTISGALAEGTSGAGTVTINNGGTVAVNGGPNYYQAIDNTTINAGGKLTIDNHSNISNLTLVGGELASTGTDPTWAINGITTVTGGVTSTISANQVTLSGGVFDVGSGSTLNFTGSANSGSLTKNGEGTMTITAYQRYTGGTTINNGTLELIGQTIGYGWLRGAVTVNPGGTLKFSGGDGTGFGFYAPVITSLAINGGIFETTNDHTHFGWGNYMTVALSNGGTITGSVVCNGDELFGFSSTGDSTNTISGSWALRNDNGANHTFNVADGAAATDLQVNANLYDPFFLNYDSPGWFYPFPWMAPSNLVKSGAGTMVLAGTNTYGGFTVVNGGTLVLAGANNYLGPTLVNEGTLEVAPTGTMLFWPSSYGTTHGISSSGAATATLSFLGTVSLDLRGAAPTAGNSWNLVNVGSFNSAPVLMPAAVTTSTGGSFTEVTPGTWELAATGAKWVFTVADGNLAYVNNASPYETWGSTYSLAAGTENGDLDNDGLTNFQEFAFGLIPSSGSSVNPITSQLNPTSGQFTYQRLNGSGLTYTIWTSTDLVNWTEDTTAVQSVTSGTPNDSVQVTLTGAPLTASKLFVRVKAQ